MREAAAIISGLRRFGIQLYVKDGTVHGKMPGGQKMPLEAKQLAEQLRLYNDAAVELLEAEQIHEVVMRTADEARDWKAKADAGQIEIVGPVVYDDATGTAVLKYRERLS